LLTKDW